VGDIVKYCQGPKCHTYDTKDRKRGPKGNKVNQTRRKSSFYYGGSNFCSLNCQNDWFEEFGNRAIDYFGRITQAIVLTENNGWYKRRNYYTWQRENGEPEFYFFNMVTREQRTLTQEQYNDSNYTLNER
jgi:hypothetical protein